MDPIVRYQAANNAAAAMAYAQQIINDLGVNGATPNVYRKLKNLEDDVQNIQAVGHPVDPRHPK